MGWDNLRGFLAAGHQIEKLQTGRLYFQSLRQRATQVVVRYLIEVAGLTVKTREMRVNKNHVKKLLNFAYIPILVIREL